jgi:hypothetical protein
MTATLVMTGLLGGLVAFAEAQVVGGWDPYGQYRVGYAPYQATYAYPVYKQFGKFGYVKGFQQETRTYLPTDPNAPGNVPALHPSYYATYHQPPAYYHGTVIVPTFVPEYYRSSYYPSYYYPTKP